MCIQLHSVKSLSRKTENFVIISHSKLDLYHDADLLYACVINSSHSGVFFVGYHEIENTRVSFVLASSSRFAGYVKIEVKTFSLFCSTLTDVVEETQTKTCRTRLW